MSAPGDVKYTLEQRTFALKCLWAHPGDKAKAAAELRSTWPKEWGRVPPHPSEFMERQQRNMNEHCTLRDAPRSGPKLKLGKEECEVAAALFMKGYYAPTSNPKVLEWHGFSSFNQALKREPALNQLRKRCKVSKRTLFRRILSAHPEIHKYRRDYKRKKSPEQRRERQATAKLWLRNHRANPRRWLRRLVWFDEGVIDLEDAATLPLTMRVIAANEGACVRGPNCQVSRGTGGDWAPKGLR